MRATSVVFAIHPAIRNPLPLAHSLFSPLSLIPSNNQASKSVSSPSSLHRPLHRLTLSAGDLNTLLPQTDTLQPTSWGTWSAACPSLVLRRNSSSSAVHRTDTCAVKRRLISTSSSSATSTLASRRPPDVSHTSIDSGVTAITYIGIQT